MAKNTEKRTRTVNLFITPNALTSIFKRLKGDKSDYDFSGLSDLRQLLSNEKAKILNIIKNQNPESMYRLARILGRDFKAVREDIKLLERFGFIELKEEKTKNRVRHRPVIVVDTVSINVKI